MPAGERGAASVGPAATLALAGSYALLLALAFEPFALWPLSFLALVPLTWMAVAARRGALAIGAAYGAQVLLWLWLNWWMFDVTAPGYVVLALFLSLYTALFVWLIRRLARTLPLPMTVLLPVVWVAVEFLRGEVVFHGYAWHELGQPLIDAPLLVQSADLFGAYLIGFLVALAAGAVLDLGLLRGLPANRRAGSLVALVVLIWIANILYGAYRLGQTAPLAPGPTLLLIQTNLPQDNKVGWTIEQQQEDVPRFLNMTRDALPAAQSPIDLIVWPETMLPGFGLEPGTIEQIKRFGERAAHLYRWGEVLTELSAELGVPILVGSPAWVDAALVETEGSVQLVPEHQYNSAYLIQGSPPFQRYDKYQLTPFGETMPYISAWPWLEEKLLALGAQGMSFSLDANPVLRRLVLETNEGSFVLGTPICYEDTVGRVCRRMVYDRGRKQADLLVNLSNDGWFGRSDATRREHNQIARFRCIENRVPLARAVNTGQSVAIDSLGRVIASLGEGRYGEARRSGVLEARLTLDRRQTLYGTVGDGWGWGCLLFTAALLAWTFRRRAATGSTR